MNFYRPLTKSVSHSVHRGGVASRGVCIGGVASGGVHLERSTSVGRLHAKGGGSASGGLHRGDTPLHWIPWDTVNEWAASSY